MISLIISSWAYQRHEWPRDALMAYRCESRITISGVYHADVAVVRVIKRILNVVSRSIEIIFGFSFPVSYLSLLSSSI